MFGQLEYVLGFCCCLCCWYGFLLLVFLCFKLIRKSRSTDKCAVWLVSWCMLTESPRLPFEVIQMKYRDIFPISKLPNILFSHQSSVHSICAIRGSIRPNLKNLQHHHGAFPKLLSNYSLIPQCYKKRRKLDLVWQSYNFEFLLKSSKLAYLLFASSLQLCHARDFTRTICK